MLCNFRLAHYELSIWTSYYYNQTIKFRLLATCCEGGQRDTKMEEAISDLCQRTTVDKSNGKEVEHLLDLIIPVTFENN